MNLPIVGPLVVAFRAFLHGCRHGLPLGQFLIDNHGLFFGAVGYLLGYTIGVFILWG